MKRIAILFANGGAIDLEIEDGKATVLRTYNWDEDAPHAVDEFYRAVPVEMDQGIFEGIEEMKAEAGPLDDDMPDAEGEE